MAVALVPSSPGQNTFIASAAAFGITLGVTVGAGNCIVVVISYSTQNAANLVNNITDNGTGTALYSKISSKTQGTSTTGSVVEVWSTGPTGSVANTTIVTVHFSPSASANGAGCVAAYSGVGSIGVSSSNSAAASTTLSITQAVAAAADFLVVGFTNNGTATTFTATAGNRRTQTTTAPIIGSLFDNTGSTSLTVSATVTASSTWAAVAVDLKPPAAGYFGLGTSMGCVM